MASTYSDRLKLELMETGANANIWGNNTNTNLETVDAFTAGFLSKSVAGSANVTLTTANADPTAESSNRVIDLNGTLTGSIHVFIPAVESNYVIRNNTSGSFTVTVAATGHAANGIAVQQGNYSFLYCDGASNYNVKNIFSTIGNISANVTGNLTGDVTGDITGNVTTDSIVDTGNNNIISSDGSGNLTLGFPTGTQWQSIVSANTSVATNNGYLVNTAAAAITLTLPGSPSSGDEIFFIDIAENASTNNITIARNGSNIGGTAANLTVTTDGAGFQLVYTNATYGWVLMNK